MRIALVSSYAFTDEPGGVKDFILGLKSALEKKNCAVFVIAPFSKEAKGLVDFTLGRPFKIATDQTQFRASLARKKTAEKIFKRINPDIIVIHEPFVPSIGHTVISTVLAGSRLKQQPMADKPIVVGQFHASREDMSWGLKIIEFIGRHLVRRPKLNKKTVFGLSSGYAATINNNLNGRIAVSEASKKIWQRKFPAEYKVIYNGIDTKELSPDGSKIKNWGTRRTIFFAGRHDARKGIDDLINALSLLIKGGMFDIQLKIAGEGEMTKFLQKMTRKLKLNDFVEFVGVMPRSELVKAYRTADVVVASSTAGEGFNRTIIEARSCGTLVVCTDIDGQREAIGRDLSKFMAKPRNPRSLSRQIKAILNLSYKKKQEIRKQGRKDVGARFDWSNIANQHLNFYQQMINGKKKIKRLSLQ